MVSTADRRICSMCGSNFNLIYRPAFGEYSFVIPRLLATQNLRLDTNSKHEGFHIRLRRFKNNTSPRGPSSNAPFNPSDLTPNRSNTRTQPKILKNLLPKSLRQQTQRVPTQNPLQRFLGTPLHDRLETLTNNG